MMATLTNHDTITYLKSKESYRILLVFDTSGHHVNDHQRHCVETPQAYTSGLSCLPYIHDLYPTARFTDRSIMIDPT